MTDQPLSPKEREAMMNAQIQALRDERSEWFNEKELMLTIIEDLSERLGYSSSLYKRKD